MNDNMNTVTFTPMIKYSCMPKNNINSEIEEPLVIAEVVNINVDKYIDISYDKPEANMMTTIKEKLKDENLTDRDQKLVSNLIIQQKRYHKKMYKELNEWYHKCIIPENATIETSKPKEQENSIKIQKEKKMDKKHKPKKPYKSKKNK
ncbi:hypothetical protein A3Q56_01645 [Intoshia linei]|uniref:Uncharacterized protein n=1 Tax=Intoshia linei TaxID=1819745 RepID=A0A177B8C5_9BILA|nr:hypothetical protein A3Q56_01645 [Intoshia linei]